MKNVIACFCLLLFCAFNWNNHDKIPVQMGPKILFLELAITPQAQYKGLSFRSSLNDDEGMLFVFAQPDIKQFVMRDCSFPIDLIYLDEEGYIVNLYSMQVEPKNIPHEFLTSYTSSTFVKYAIELKGGSISELGLKIGQKISIPL